MVRFRERLGSLRFSRLEKERLLVALLLSLGAHLGGWGVYEAGKKIGWWHPAKHSTQLFAAKKNPPPDSEPPMIFVDVSHAEPEPPKKTIFYSNKNSIAANPDVTVETEKPKITGRQKDVPKTEDVPRLPKLQPTPPAEQSEPAPPAEPKPVASPMNFGDLQLAKADNATPEKQTSQPRPRTLKAAQAQRTDQTPGVAMKQDGGVLRQRIWSSLDAKATAFGDYDRKIVDAVTDRWYGLLDSKNFAQDRTGKVILRFKLKFDGTVQNMETLENTVGELLGYVCQQSINEAAPFEKWPDDMRRMVGANFRDITFTFYYY